MSRSNNSYYTVLGILGFGPISGYGIKMWVDTGVGYFLDIDYKQIYPTLKKMVEDNLATFEVEKSGNRPESKVYTITAKGLDELRNWLSKPINPGKQSVSELYLKLFFGHHVPLEKNLEHLRRFKESNLEGLKTLQNIEERFTEKEFKDASWHYRLTTVISGEMMRKAQIDWCDKTIEYLSQSIEKCPDTE